MCVSQGTVGWGLNSQRPPAGPQNLDALPRSTSSPAVPPPHTKPAADACGKACQGTAPATTLWVWSPASKNCYCTTLTSMALGKASTGDVTGCLASASWCKGASPPPPGPKPHPHPHSPPPPSPPLPPLPSTPTREPNMNGRYQLSETKGSNTSKYPDYRDCKCQSCS